MYNNKKEVVRLVNYQVSLLNQFLGTLFISFIFFLIALGVLYLYFSHRSNRIHGIILIVLGLVFTVILYGIARYLITKGELVPWWHIFKIEAFFADLGALAGVMVVIGIIMVIIIQIDRHE